MGAPTNHYVDPSIAADSGTGTSGDPYGDLQYALNQISRDATNGDQINIKSGTDEILASALSLTTYGTPGEFTPLIFRGYTSAANDGGVGGIDGNAGNFSILASGSYVSFIDLHLHNTGSATIVNVAANSAVIGCEIDGSTGSGIVATSGVTGHPFIYGNNIHNCGGSGISAGGANILGNYLANGTNSFGSAISLGNDFAIVEGNIISVGGSTNGIYTNRRGHVIRGNSILSAGGTGRGIWFDSAFAEYCACENNLIEGFSGTGGYGIYIDAVPWMLSISGNAIYNCTTAYNPSNLTSAGNSDVGIVLQANESLSASPFAKSGSDTFANRFTYFAPADTGNVHGGAYVGA